MPIRFAVTNLDCITTSREAASISGLHRPPRKKHRVQIHPVGVALVFQATAANVMEILPLEMMHSDSELMVRGYQISLSQRHKQLCTADFVGLEGQSLVQTPVLPDCRSSAVYSQLSDFSMLQGLFLDYFRLLLLQGKAALGDFEQRLHSIWWRQREFQFLPQVRFRLLLSGRFFWSGRHNLCSWKDAHSLDGSICQLTRLVVCLRCNFYFSQYEQVLLENVFFNASSFSCQSHSTEWELDPHEEVCDSTCILGGLFPVV